MVAVPSIEPMKPIREPGVGTAAQTVPSCYQPPMIFTSLKVTDCQFCKLVYPQSAPKQHRQDRSVSLAFHGVDVDGRRCGVEADAEGLRLSLRQRSVDPFPEERTHPGKVDGAPGAIAAFEATADEKATASKASKEIPKFDFAILTIDPHSVSVPRICLKRAVFCSDQVRKGVREASAEWTRGLCGTTGREAGMRAMKNCCEIYNLGGRVGTKKPRDSAIEGTCV